MGKVHVYVNQPDDCQFPERELQLIDRAGYTVDLRAVTVDHAPSSQSATSRAQLSVLVRRMAPGTTVVVTRLSCLGCSARDILITLERFRSAGVHVRCLETGKSDLTGRTEPSAVRTLRALVRIESTAKSVRARQSIAEARATGRRPGRRPALSDAQRTRVVKSIASGLSISEIARQFRTSRQTILRIRNAQALTQGNDA